MLGIVLRSLKPPLDVLHQLPREFLPFKEPRGRKRGRRAGQRIGIG